MVDVARDYYHTGMTIREIAVKHKILPSEIKLIAKKFDKDEISPIKKMAVIKVEEKWVDHIIELLKRRGIEAEAPENYELLEMFESKINN